MTRETPSDALETSPAAGEQLSMPGLRFSRIAAAVVGVGGLLAALGAFLPWVRLQGAGVDISHSGIEAAGDGYITLGLGALLAGLAARTLNRNELPSRAFGWIAMISGFFLVSIPALDFQAFRQSLLLLDPSAAALIRPEIGLFATVIAGALAIFGGWQSRRRPRARQVSPG